MKLMTRSTLTTLLQLLTLMQHMKLMQLMQLMQHLTTLLPPPHTQRNMKTMAQLEEENRMVIQIKKVRSDPPTAPMRGHDDALKKFLAGKIESAKPLDESIFWVSFDGFVYTVNMPESLVPAALALPNFTVIKPDAKYLFTIVEVKDVTKGSMRESDDNWATLFLHKNELTNIARIRELTVAHFDKHGFVIPDGKAGFNADKRPKISINFDIPDPDTVYRHRLKEIRKLKMDAANNVWLGEPFCKAWGICSRCHGTILETDWKQTCGGRCHDEDSQYKKRKAPEPAPGPSVQFGAEDEADF